MGRLLGDRRGATAVEFAFVGMSFFVLLLGATDLGRYQFTVQSLRDISAEAARVALIDANRAASLTAQGRPTATMSDAALRTAVTSPTNPTPFLTPASITLTTARTAAGGVSTIAVTVTYPFTFVAPLLPGAALTLTDTSAVSY